MPTTPAAQTGANVRAEMARRGVSQAQLAAHIHLSQTAVSSRLRGITAFDISELVTVAEFLGVETASLLPRPQATPTGVAS